MSEECNILSKALFASIINLFGSIFHLISVLLANDTCYDQINDEIDCDLFKDDAACEMFKDDHCNEKVRVTNLFWIILLSFASALQFIALVIFAITWCIKGTKKAVGHSCIEAVRVFEIIVDALEVIFVIVLLSLDSWNPEGAFNIVTAILDICADIADLMI